MHASPPGRPVNPYIAGKPVNSAEMFFGREDVFDVIRRNLAGRDYSHSIVLYGQRRTGKTSVLYQLHRHLDAGYWCVFIDLHGLNLDSLGSLLYGIARAISRALRREHQVTVEAPRWPASLADPATAFETDFTDFLDRVWAAIGDHQLVVMLDEAVRLDEETRAGRLDRHVFEYLRFLTQHQERLSFIFVLGVGMEEMSRDTTFLYTASLYCPISFLRPEAARDLITRPVSGLYELTGRAVDRILSVTRGHPYYTQLISHCVFSSWARGPAATVDVGVVEDALYEAIELGSPNLAYIWQDSTPAEQAVMAAIAAAAQGSRAAVTASRVLEALRGADIGVPDYEIAQALQGLSRREVIAAAGVYSFTVDLQRLWLDRHRPLSRVKEELAEAIGGWERARPLHADRPEDQPAKTGSPGHAGVLAPSSADEPQPGALAAGSPDTAAVAQTGSIQQLQAQLSATLMEAESWVRSLSHLPGSMANVISPGPRCAAELRRLRTSAAPALVSVAVLGAFSSGKSSLVSGLQGKLEAVDVSNLDGLPAEAFVGILPTSPVPVTACPARVVPVTEDAEVDASGRGFMRVRFNDSPEWEDIGSNPRLPVAAAYLTGAADRSNRLSGHREREVAEVEILLSGYKVPAVVYDLPIYGSLNPLHDTVIKAAMSAADCFIYVTRANRTLAAEDLELIRSLYDYHLSTDKQVIWVLTAIDEAANLDHTGTTAWRRLIEHNNSYLSENFTTVTGMPESRFIGIGFIPVSPVEEARARARAARRDHGGPGHLQARQVLDGMDGLRKVILGIAETQAGRKHIAAAAREAEALVRPLANAITVRLEEERIPLETEADALAANQESARRTHAALARAPEDLEAILSARVKRASCPFSALAGHLHAQLDDTIRNTDIRNRTKANRISVATTQVTQAWISAPGGPGDLGEQEIREFQQDIADWVSVNVENGATASSPHRTRIDLASLALGTAAFRKDVRAGTPPSPADVAGGAALFSSAAVIADAAALPAVGLFKRNAAWTLHAMQDDRIADLDNRALSLQGQFEAALSKQGMLMIDAVTSGLRAYQEQLASSAARIKERIDDPGYQEGRSLVDTLQSLSTEGQKTTNELAALKARCLQ
jgi:AAA ATPase domain